MPYLKIFIFLFISSNLLGQNNLNTVVYFDKNSSTLNVDSKNKLSEWVATYRKISKFTIHLQGHTDIDGRERSNLLLSKKRVEQVSAFLKKEGIDAVIDYAGEQKPLNLNTDEKEKELNRRVEIKVIDDKINAFFQNLDLNKVDEASKIQIFKGNAQDTLKIKGWKGTRILFFPNTLINSKKEKVFGEISIELREFYSKSSMIWNRLSTITVDSQLLVSNGMIELYAYQNNEKLTLSDNSKVLIDFPKRKIDDKMLLWEGIDTGSVVTWKAIPNSIPQNTPLDTISLLKKFFELLPNKDFYENAIKDKKLKISFDETENKDSTNVFVQIVSQDPFILGYIGIDTAFGTNSTQVKPYNNSILANLAFSSSKLGFINCDYFLKKNRKSLINWRILSENWVNIAVIFPKDNVVLLGVPMLDKVLLEFPNVPKGEPVEILAFSLDEKTKTYFFEKRKGRIGQKIDLDLKSCDFETIEEAINAYK